MGKKRKSRLDTELQNANEVNQTVMFHEMGLDDRILKAIAKLCWEQPTPIQERAIPLALEGKDILARARTGSGKTGAFAIPLIQRILQVKETENKEASVLGLIMAPTKELCRQIFKDISALSSSCSRDFRCLDISYQVDLSVQKPLLMDMPDVVIGPPSRVLAHLQAGNLSLKHSLQMLVIDEADLIFSLGRKDDVKTILQFLPQICQTILMSATLSEDVQALKKLVLHNAVILKLQEPQLPTSSQLAQYYIHLEEEDKFVVIYTLFKIKLIQGKSLIFVKNVNRCYKLKLFLEQFGIRCCVLNGELPMVSRCHIVSLFNAGNMDIIIASDEKLLQETDTPPDEQPKKKRFKVDKEAGVARGIDFQFVSNVINFDFPTQFDSYVHRVGRTARGTNKGSAISFVSVKEQESFLEIKDDLKNMYSSEKDILKEFKFDMSEAEGFRYRARDAWRSVTKIAIREARLKEIKMELLNSQKLKAYWEENPRELEALRHDKALHTVRHSSHLKHVPDYIVPESLKKKQQQQEEEEEGDVMQEEDPSVEADKPKKKKKVKKKFMSKKKRENLKRMADPLQNMEFQGFDKKNSR